MVAGCGVCRAATALAACCAFRAASVCLSRSRDDGCLCQQVLFWAIDGGVEMTKLMIDVRASPGPAAGVWEFASSVALLPSFSAATGRVITGGGLPRVPGSSAVRRRPERQDPEELDAAQLRPRQGEVRPLPREGRLPGGRPEGAAVVHLRCSTAVFVASRAAPASSAHRSRPPRPSSAQYYGADVYGSAPAWAGHRRCSGQLHSRKSSHGRRCERDRTPHHRGGAAGSRLALRTAPGPRPLLGPAARARASTPTRRTSCATGAATRTRRRTRCGRAGARRRKPAMRSAGGAQRAARER